MSNNPFASVCSSPLTTEIEVSAVPSAGVVADAIKQYTSSLVVVQLSSGAYEIKDFVFTASSTSSTLKFDITTLEIGTTCGGPSLNNVQQIIVDVPTTNSISSRKLFCCIKVQEVIEFKS